MAKIRVYELATKMGLDNKDVVEKLQQAGIEVKNHMSAVEEDVAQKFEAEQAGRIVDAPEAEENVEVKVKEERISSGLIRRRRKTVVKEEPVVEEQAAAEAPVEEQAVAEAPVEEQAVAEEVTAEAAEEVQAGPKAEATEGAEAQLEIADQAAPKKKTKKEPVRAKILGRVELPTPAERPRRQGAAAERGKKPETGERKRQDRPAARPCCASSGTSRSPWNPGRSTGHAFGERRAFSEKEKEGPRHRSNRD